MEDYDVSLDELKAEARQAIGDLPAEAKAEFEKLLGQQEVVTQVLEDLPTGQRQRITPLFKAIFERTWQPAHQHAGVT